jgi:hypothetical protein
MKSRKGTRKAAASRKTGKSGNVQEALTSTPPVEEIRARAYEIYIERGQRSGEDLENWLQAEKELTEAIRKPHSD